MIFEEQWRYFVIFQQLKIDGYVVIPMRSGLWILPDHKWPL